MPGHWSGETRAQSRAQTLMGAIPAVVGQLLEGLLDR
jgi:hypothetical protein